MIIRTARKERYTIVDNRILEDSRLSFKAKGVLCYLLSRPDNWTESDDHLATIGLEGESAIRSALKELETAGYLQRKRRQNDKGLFEWEHYIYDESQTREQPSVENPPVDNPPAENPRVDNRTVINTNITSTEKKEVRRPPMKREAAPKQRVYAAAEIGVSPKLLTTLTNTLLDLTGGRALADAGDEYKLRDTQDAAILLARIGYGTADALKELGDSWRNANEWRNSLPSIRNLKDYAGQRAAGTNGKSRESSWADLNQGVPDYMRG
jgi:hypothetical protein